MNQNDLDNDIRTRGKIDYGHNYLTRGTGKLAANEVGRTRSSSVETLHSTRWTLPTHVHWKPRFGFDCRFV